MQITREPEFLSDQTHAVSSDLKLYQYRRFENGRILLANPEIGFIVPAKGS